MLKRYLKKIPHSILDSLKTWITYLEMIGLAETRKISGYHDERVPRGCTKDGGGPSEIVLQEKISNYRRIRCNDVGDNE